MNEFDDMEMKPDKDLERAREIALLSTFGPRCEVHSRLSLAIARAMKEVRDEAIEESAKACEQWWEVWQAGHPAGNPNHIAGCIRALKGGEK